MQDPKEIIQDQIFEKYAVGLYKKYAQAIANIVGAPDIPKIKIKILKECPHPAFVEWDTVFVNRHYFSAENDEGALIHEFVHVIMVVTPYYNETNSWLLEGIADYIRDKLGFQTSWSTAHYEQGKALAGYQTSAHFLMYLEELSPTAVKDICRLVTDRGGYRWFINCLRKICGLPVSGEYDDKIFINLFGKSLPELVEQYEKEQERQG